MMPAFLSPGTGALDCPPAAPTAHAWMPSSPCGPECVETAPEAGRLRFAARLLGIGAVAVSFPVAYLATPRRHRRKLQTRYARTLLSCCGIQVRIVDRRTSGEPGAVDCGAAQERAALGDSGAAQGNAVIGSGAGAAAESQGVLVVAGHIGWTDIIALSAVEPLAFVARADMVDWPVLGGIARRVRVIPIERERLRELPGVVNRIAERLTAGERIGVFPEGTTWCGRAHGRLRPALFQAAIDTGTPVQPIRLRYLDAHGDVCTVPGFVGIDTMADSFRRVLRSRGVVAELVLQPLELPGADRRDLARRCEQAIRGDAVDRAFADIIGRDDSGSEHAELIVQAPENRHPAPKVPSHV